MVERGGKRLVRAGAIVTALCLVLPPLWVVALVLGILLIVRQRARAGILVLVLGVAVLPAIGSALYLVFVVGTYRLPSESMQPGLRVQERFVALKLDKSAEVGDVIVFKPPVGAVQEASQCGERAPQRAMCARPVPGEASVEYVKRVVAVGGDRIAMRDGRIVRNGRPEPGRPLGDCGGEGCDYPEEITVPDGHLFMLGDNRGASDDSRFWGPVPEDAVTGRYWFTYSGG